MRTLFVSGGSAGHLAPLVAVARAMKRVDANTEIAFVCSDRLEDAAYLSKEKITPALILSRPARNLLLPLTLMRDYKEASAFIHEWKPDVVFTKGAAISVPVCYAAHRKNIPIVIHESDAVMGNANRLIARWAKKVCLGMEAESREQKAERDFSTLSAQRFIVTGNPVRPEILEGSRTEGLRITGLSGSKPILLVWGGSQGAETLNAAVRAHIDELLETCDVIHLTGKGKKGAEPRAGYCTMEFAHTELPHLFAITTLAVSRAGAGTISELSANAIPTVLVPIRGLAHDHQFRNATTAQENGGCILLLQENLDAKLVSTVHVLASDTALRTEISQKMTSLHRPEAALHIAEIIAGCVASRGESH